MIALSNTGISKDTNQEYFFYLPKQRHRFYHLLITTMRNHQYFLPAIQCFFLLATLANHYKAAAAAAADNNELVFQDIPHEEGGDLLSSSLRRSLQLDLSSEVGGKMMFHRCLSWNNSSLV